MADRQDLQKQLNRLKYRVHEQTKGKVCYSPKIAKMLYEIEAIQAQITVLDAQATDRIGLSKLPLEELSEIIMMPLIADVMNDVLATVDGMLRRAGASETVFGDYVKQIRTATMAMVDTLDHPELCIRSLLDDDDTLVDAIKKKLRSYIIRRLAPINERYKELQKQESKKR